MLYYQASFYMWWVLFICKGSTSFIESSIYKSVRITQQKEHLLIMNSETTQNLNIYLHNYQTETAIFLATKHEKNNYGTQLFKFFHTENTSAKKWWLLWGIAQWKWLWGCFNQFLLLWIYYSANASEAVQKRRLAQGHC